MKQEQLKKAYTPIPEDFHNALYAAAHSVKEERKVKRPFRAVLIVVIITALLCGSAVALNNINSVRNTWGGPEKTEEFLNHVIDLNQTYENEFVKVTLTDAVFDGKQFELAMNLECKDETKPVYLYPKTTATANGEKLEFDVEGMAGDFMSGFLYPNLKDGDTCAGGYGFSGVLLDKKVKGDEVVWTFTMQIMKPNWPIADYVNIPQTSAGMTAEEYLDPFYKAFAEKRILTAWGDSLVEYGCAAEQAVDFGDREYLRLNEALLESGAFSLIETIEHSFTMSVPESYQTKVASGKAITFDDFTLNIDSIDVSFMRVDYAMTLVPAKSETEKSIRENSLYPTSFSLLDTDGHLLYSGSGGGDYEQLANGSWGIKLHSSLNVTGEMPQRLIFAPVSWEDDSVDIVHSFSIELK